MAFPSKLGTETLFAPLCTPYLIVYRGVSGSDVRHGSFMYLGRDTADKANLWIRKAGLGFRSISIKALLTMSATDVHVVSVDLVHLQAHPLIL
jgi:hypothetical protein